MTITSKLPNAKADWRISYFGFEDEAQAQTFAQSLQNKKYLVREGKRLKAEFEVKVWALSREEVLRFKANAERTHWLEFRPANAPSLCQMVINGTFVGNILVSDQRWYQERLQQCDGMNHREAIKAMSGYVLGQMTKAA